MGVDKKRLLEPFVSQRYQTSCQTTICGKSGTRGGPIALDMSYEQPIFFIKNRTSQRNSLVLDLT